MKAFVSKKFIIPEKLETDKYIIRKLTVKDCKLDYEAMVSSVDIIKKVRGETSCHSTWPSKDFTFEENKKDLEGMGKDFSKRKAFNFTIMNKEETKCLGSIYFFPIHLYFPKEKEKYDVDFSMWVTQEAYDQGLYPELFSIVINWLKKDWPWNFARIKIRNAEVPTGF